MFVLILENIGILNSIVFLYLVMCVMCGYMFYLRELFLVLLYVIGYWLMSLVGMCCVVFNYCCLSFLIVLGLDRFGCGCVVVLMIGKFLEFMGSLEILKYWGILNFWVIIIGILMFKRVRVIGNNMIVFSK